MKEDKILKLLSKLMSSQKGRENANEKYYEEIYKFAGGSLNATVEESGFPEKANYTYQIGQILEDMKFLSDFPMLLGKTVIGILGTKRNCEYQFLGDFLSEDINRLLNSKVPTVIYESGTDSITITAQNKLDNRIQLFRDEYFLCDQLENYDIDIRSLVDLFAIGVEQKLNHIVYVYLPYYALRNTEEYIRLLHTFDCVVACCASSYGYEERIEKRIQKLRNQYEGPLYLVPMDEDVADWLKAFGEKQKYASAETAGRYEIKGKILQKWDDARYNFSFANSIYMQMLCIQKYVYEKKSEQERLISKINQNLLNLSDEASKEKIREYKRILEGKYEMSKRRYSQIKNDAAYLMELVTKLEKLLMWEAFGNITDKEQDHTLYHNKYGLECLKIVFELIGMKEQALTREYLNKLERRDYPNMLLLHEYINYINRGEVFNETLRHAISSVDEKKKDWLYDRMIVLFYREIGISSASVAERLIRKERKYSKEGKYSKGGRHSKEENSFLGEYYTDKIPECSYNYLFAALREGDAAAGSKILKLPELPISEEQMEELADMLVPEANLIVGKRLIGRHYASGLRYLKIAAALGNMEALILVADYEYKHICKNKECQRIMYGTQKNTKQGGILGNARNLLKVYRYLSESGYHDYERLGVLSYLLADYQSAREYLQESDSDLSHFILGMIYEHGYATAVQLQKAKQEYNKARFKIKEADARYDRVNGKIAAEESERIAAADIGDVVVNIETGERHLCFITTAVCEALGKDDDCQELISLREYRDNILTVEEGGKEIIEEYYKIAPTIVMKINKIPRCKDIYEGLYNSYIVPIMRYLDEKKYDCVRETYTIMVKELEKEYLNIN